MLPHRVRVEMAQRLNIRFTLNGRKVSAEVRPDETLVEMLEYRFDLRGARESCGQGLCGCCTVYVNSKPVSSCLFLAVRADSARIDTIEGLGSADTLDPVQQAFVDAGAFQCGFCTPGFIMMVKQLLKDNPNPSEDDVKHYLVGNLCRCSAYPEILDAVKLAASRLAAVSAR
jgi:carbon-monoxide dehydrogenase small subunit